MSRGVDVMVIYHPGYDVNHCVYRILNILNSIDNHETQKDVLRLIDFYYLYPHLLKSVNLPRPLNRYKDIIFSTPDPFEVTPNPRSLFYELSRIQDSAMLALQQKSIIKLTASTITLLSNSLPDDLIKTFNNDSFSKSELFKGLISALPKVKLEGKTGFKFKSGLMEYRYD